MFAKVPNPIPARMKGLNRAEICDVNFSEFVREWNGRGDAKPSPGEAILDGSALDARGFRELFESQLISRHLDLMARVLRVQNKVFYTIGSSGHEGNAMVARATRHTDPAFLHYRSGGFMAERFRKLPGMDPVLDSALSFAASKDDPASGGRHKVWGSRPLWVLPQTSTIASHLPKAFGTAVAIGQARRIGHALPIPDDSIAICSFGDASSNHATAQTAFNAAAWTAYQKLPAPVLFVCEDNGIGISVKTPDGWVARNFAHRPDLDYFAADGLDLATGYADVQRAVEHCRRTRRPTFLHLRTTRIMGHAGTDFEIEWRSLAELCAVEATDPLLRSAAIALESGLMSKDEVLALYEATRAKCFAAAEEAGLATSARLEPGRPLARMPVDSVSGPVFALGRDGISDLAPGLAPQGRAGRAGVGECAGNADRADGVQLVCVGEDLRLEGGRLRIVAEAMRLDRMRHRVGERSGPIRQDLPRALCADQVVAGAIRALADVVQQRSRTNDRQVRALCPRNAFGECGHAQHVVEVVPAAAGIVERARIFDGDGRLAHARGSRSAPARRARPTRSRRRGCRSTAPHPAPARCSPRGGSRAPRPRTPRTRSADPWRAPRRTSSLPGWAARSGLRAPGRR